MKKNTLLYRVKSIFFNGFFAIFPITATIFVLNFIYKVSSRWLTPLRDLEPEMLQRIPGSEIILVILIIFFIGILVKIFVISPLIHSIERIIAKIPFINSIYSAAKALTDFFNVPEPEHFSRKVVLIQYPRPDSYAIAFLLGSAYIFEKLLPEQSNQEEKFRVFMPTSPTPGTGFFFILPRSEIIDTDITFEEAIKLIVSCGLIAPESLKLNLDKHQET